MGRPPKKVSAAVDQTAALGVEDDRGGQTTFDAVKVLRRRREDKRELAAKRPSYRLGKRRAAGFRVREVSSAGDRVPALRPR